MNEPIQQIVEAVIRGRRLSADDAAAVFGEVVSGRIADPQIEALLLALADRGATVDELVGAADVMRRFVTRIHCHAADAIDTCGAGGDGISTFNVSTAAAIIAAAAGTTVAKHGNRTNSRASGSAEAIAALGVNIHAAPAVVERCLREAGIGFLFAPNLHPAMQRVAAIRRKIGHPTIFNLLGPLTNPAFVRRQIIGVPRPELMTTLAEALRRLGAERAFVVHGHDGLCDLSITGPSRWVELRDGQLLTGTIAPEDVGFSPAPLETLCVTGPEQSADVIRAILSGAPGPCRNHTVLNAALAIWVSGRGIDFQDALARATDAVDSGAAARTLKRLAELSHADGGNPTRPQ